MSVACKIFDPRRPAGAVRNGFISPQRLILKEELRMKKVLSLVLAFAMILGSFGFVFASEFSDVTDTEYYSEPVNVLTGFGVIAGYPDGTFKPANVVTRAEMVTMIVAALNIPVKGGATTKRFSDVELTHWAAGYIDYGASVGFVAGYPDGTFKPEQTVSYNEALTMIVAALGYTAESLPGVWPGNFVNKAQSLGILDICRTTGTAGAPRQDVACFLYSALPQYIGYVDKDGAFHTNIGKDGNSDTMLNRLGATAYNADAYGEAQPFVVTGEEDSQINLQNYLGAYVTAYQNKDEEIVAIKEVLSEFIEGDYDDLKDEYKFDSATKVDYISFLNGEQNGSKDYAGEDGIKLAVKLSGKNVKEVYSMQQWEAKSTFRAADDIQDEIIDDQAIGGFAFPLDEDDEIDAKAFAMVGKSAISELAEDDIITVYLNKNDEIVKIEVSTETIEGAVTKINTAGTKYTIGGKAYGIAEFSSLAPALEDEGTWYLDYAGKLFDFDEADDTTSNYAIILATGADAGRYGSSSGYAKLLLADGTTKEYQVKSDVTGTISGNAWANASSYPAGALVKYALNSSDVVTELTVATDTAADKAFDANGIYNNIALASGTAIFSYKEGGDLDDADSYEVLKAADLNEAEFKKITYMAESGSFKAVLIEGISAGEDIYAIFISKDAKTSDGNVWTALYDGEVTELTLEESLAPTTFTTGSAAMYTLTFDGDDIVTKTTAASGTSVSANVAKATSVSGNVFKDGDSKSYSLDANIAVYVYDESDDEWAAKAKSALGGRKGAFNSITLVDTDADGDYDIAIVVKP